MTVLPRISVAEPSWLQIAAGLLLGPAALLAVLAVLAATVRFTLPGVNRDTVGCDAAPTPVPLTDLDSVFVWMQPRGVKRPSLVLGASVRGREGQPMSVEVPTDSVATVWVQTSDVTGNRSCESNYVGVNFTAGVPPAPFPSGSSVEWFDVAGRRVRPPRTPGVYFVRRGRGKPVHVVVLR